VAVTPARDLRGIRVTDPHIHLCDIGSGLYPHFANRPPGTPFSKSYLLADFLADAAAGPEIVAAVHVEAFPTDFVRESTIVQDIADRSPIPIGIVGHADLLAADLEAVLDGHAALPGFRGIRQVVNVHRDRAFTQAKRDLLNAPGFAAGLRALGRRGLSFDMQLLGHQMLRGAEIAAAARGTAIVVNHAGHWTDRDPDGWRTWKAGLRRLAACDNVSIKISGLGMRDRAWTAESIRPLVYEVLEAFGTARSMFASNFPVDGKAASYTDVWRGFDAVTGSLGADERDRLFRANAVRFYRLDAPTAHRREPADAKGKALT
jgi:predicted TIM-barrel fold metal-dependent hydrolase